MFGNHIAEKAIRFGAVFGVANNDGDVFKVVGVMGGNETTLSGRQCSLIVDCATAINVKTFLSGLNAANNLAEAIRFTLKVRGVGYGCEIIEPRHFGRYLG